MANILQVTGITPHKYGGAERAMVVLAKRAHARGHRLHTQWEQRPTSHVFIDDLRRAGGVLHVLPTRGRPVVASVRLSQLMRSVSADVVHTNFSPSVIPALAAAKVVGLPSIWSIHHTLLVTGKPLTLRLRLLGHLRTGLATEVNAVAHASRDAYVKERLSRKPIGVHYIGLRLPKSERARAAVRAEWGFADDDLVVACTAFHEPVKGVDVLIRALALCQNPRLRVLQIGGDSEPSRTLGLHELARDLGVADRITWTGFRDDVSDLLAGADLYVQPSRSEGLCFALVEAAASGLAVIGTRRGGTPEIIDDLSNGLLVDAEDPPAMAAAMDRLAADKDLRDRLGEAARASAFERFDLDRQTERLIDRYEALIAAR